MYQTKEDGSFHGAGKQKSVDGHPNYEASPSSGGTITQENGDVKDDVQNQLRTFAGQGQDRGRFCVLPTFDIKI